MESTTVPRTYERCVLKVFGLFGEIVLRSTMIIVVGKPRLNTRLPRTTLKVFKTIHFTKSVEVAIQNTPISSTHRRGGEDAEKLETLRRKKMLSIWYLIQEPELNCATTTGELYQGAIGTESTDSNYEAGE
jgi:hypothetical protein